MAAGEGRPLAAPCGADSAALAAVWHRCNDREKEVPPMETPSIVSRQEWQQASEQMLVKEKEFTRARDALAAERRRMPWLAVEKDYRFEGPDGEASLLALFQDRRQLIVYRAFFAPHITTFATGGCSPDRACVGCSFVADQV